MAGLNVSAVKGSPPMAPATEVRRTDLEERNLDERERLIAALEEAGWVQAKAARLFSMTPRQIAYRIQTLKIKVRQY
jgi:Nif-specific regulatory protein